VTLPTIAAAFLILGIGASLQASVGFGMGMMSVPLLLWVGFTLPECVSMVMGAAAVQMTSGLWLYREHIDLRHSMPIAGFQCATIPLGVLAMGLLADLGKEPVQQAVGVSILAALVFRQVAKPTPRVSVPFWWGGVAGSLTGFLGGMIAMGGPPMVFYALSHAWPKEKFRAFIWTQFLTASPIILFALWWRFGNIAPAGALLGVAAAPCVIAGSRLALWATAEWDTDNAQMAAVGLLSILGVTSILRPLLG